MHIETRSSESVNRLPSVAPGRAAAGAPVNIDSETLLQGGRELRIQHAGQEYRLRLTQNDKLILTK